MSVKDEDFEIYIQINETVQENIQSLKWSTSPSVNISRGTVTLRHGEKLIVQKM